MRFSVPLGLGLAVSLPLGTGAVLSGRSDPGWVPRVGEAVIYDDGIAEEEWVVVRRCRRDEEVALDLSRGDDTTVAMLFEIRPVSGVPGF